MKSITQDDYQLFTSGRYDRLGVLLFQRRSYSLYKIIRNSTKEHQKAAFLCHLLFCGYTENRGRKDEASEHCNQTLLGTDGRVFKKQRGSETC